MSVAKANKRKYKEDYIRSRLCFPPERWRIYPARVCCTWKHWLTTVWNHSNSSSIGRTLTRSNRAKSIEQATLQ